MLVMKSGPLEEVSIIKETDNLEHACYNPFS